MSTEKSEHPGTKLSANGFKSPRPDHLPLSAAVWDAADRFDKGGPTVAEALFDALAALETEVIALRRGNGGRDDLLSLI